MFCVKSNVYLKEKWEIIKKSLLIMIWLFSIIYSKRFTCYHQYKLANIGGEEAWMEIRNCRYIRKFQNTVFGNLFASRDSHAIIQVFKFGIRSESTTKGYFWKLRRHRYPYAPKLLIILQLWSRILVRTKKI